MEIQSYGRKGKERTQSDPSISIRKKSNRLIAIRTNSAPLSIRARKKQPIELSDEKQLSARKMETREKTLNKVNLKKDTIGQKKLNSMSESSFADIKKFVNKGGLMDVELEMYYKAMYDKAQNREEKIEALVGLIVYGQDGNRTKGYYKELWETAESPDVKGRVLEEIVQVLESGKGVGITQKLIECYDAISKNGENETAKAKANGKLAKILQELKMPNREIDKKTLQLLLSRASYDTIRKFVEKGGLSSVEVEMCYQEMYNAAATRDQLINALVGLVAYNNEYINTSGPNIKDVYYNELLRVTEGSIDRNEQIDVLKKVVELIESVSRIEGERDKLIKFNEKILQLANDPETKLQALKKLVELHIKEPNVSKYLKETMKLAIDTKDKIDIFKNFLSWGEVSDSTAVYVCKILVGKLPKKMVKDLAEACKNGNCKEAAAYCCNEMMKYATSEKDKIDPLRILIEVEETPEGKLQAWNKLINLKTDDDAKLAALRNLKRTVKTLSVRDATRIFYNNYIRSELLKLEQQAERNINR